VARRCGKCGKLICVCEKTPSGDELDRRMDADMERRLRRSERDAERPDPTEEALDRVFTGATKARVFEHDAEETLLTVTKPAELAELRECLRIASSGLHCMCMGGPVLEVSGEDGVRATITLHHGQSIRWDSEWRSDAELADGRRLIEWLAARGVRGPLEEVEASQASARESARSLERWRMAAPQCLQALWSELVRQDGLWGALPDGRALGASPEALARAMSALRATYRSEDDAILALLAWYGQGAGPWSGHPSYELTAENLLWEFPTASIVRALARPVGPAHLEGAARYLCGWHFGRLRAAERRLVPGKLVEQLRAHMAESPHQENSAWLPAAFPPPV